MRHVFVVRTHEVDAKGVSRLVLEHRFFGATPEEALGYYSSHLKTDAFLRDCTTQNRWQDVTCWSDAYWAQEP